MKRRTVIIIVLGVIIIGVGWYLFRPDLLLVDRVVNEEFPGVEVEQTSSSDTPQTIVFEGRFHGVAHEAKGIATVYKLPNGKRVLRLTEFETSRGPNVAVYLVAADDSHDDETVTKAGFVNLGVLKGNIGDQNYDIPSDVDLSKYRSVSIWCRRFGVNFAAAPLVPHQG